MTGDYLNTPAPYSRTVEALLAHERVIVERPAVLRARVLARARDSINGVDGIAAKPVPSRHFVRVVLAAAAGVAVMVSAAAAYQMLRQPVSTAPHRSLQPAPPSFAVPAPEPQEVPSPGVVSPALDERAPTPAPGHRPGRVAVEELRLLDRARQSDARGDYAGVLGLAAEHERRFPQGRLAEEREVLRVRALVSLGRGGEARQAAARFRHEFPRSVLLRKVDDMLAPPR